ncbi:Fc receptor-like protein 2 isoform X1 [Prionailurus iriomotensis]
MLRLQRVPKGTSLLGQLTRVLMLLWSLLVILAPVDGKSDWLTLVAPSAVFEGDRIDLTCQKKNNWWKVKRVSYYKDGEELQLSSELSNFSIQRAEKTSRSVRIEVQELFPRPVLTVSPSRAIEGNPVTLTCETKLSPQRKQSLQLQIHVHRVPVSNISLEMRAPRGQVIEGRNLVLLCSVTEGTGNITFSWHREATGTSVGKKTQRSLSVELEVPAVQERDAGRYYCRADNGHGPIQSKVLSILVRIPVSCPVLSITAPRAQAVEGDVVELRCEAQRGSPPILYRFYYEDVPLGNSSAPSGGGASFNLSLTAEHSGNYSCEADNGLGARRSEVVPLSLSGTSSYREEQVTDRALGLLGVPACVAAALLFYCRFHKTRGRHSVTNALRDVPSANSQASIPSSPSPAIEDLQPDYVNVDPGDGDVAYSFVWSIQLPEDSENTRRTILENKDSHVIYSGVKEM